MAIMPLPALLTSSTRLPAQTSQDSYSGCSGGVLWLVASVDSLLPQHSSIGGVGKGHSITGKDVDATHYASYEFKVEGLPDSPVFPPDSSVG
ncbi:hypothetical protein ACFX13_024439 [Malus domestica]